VNRNGDFRGNKQRKMNISFVEGDVIGVGLYEETGWECLGNVLVIY
jgi:hypothetical protein